MTGFAEDNNTVRGGLATGDATVFSPPTPYSVLARETRREVRNVLLVCPGTVVTSHSTRIDIYRG